jgi:uncharacterized caspase-like protein
MKKLLGTRFFILMLLASSGASVHTRVEAQVQDKEKRAIKAMLVWGTPEAPEEVIDEAVRQLIAENLAEGRKLPQNQIDQLLRELEPALKEYEQRQELKREEEKVRAAEQANRKVAEPRSKDGRDLTQLFASTYPPCEGALIARWNNCVGDTSKASRDARDSSGSWTVPRIALAGDNFRYNGEFKDGLPHGRGLYLTSRGQRYEGEFKEGKFYGEGVFYSERGEVISSGTWRNDALVQKHEVSLAKLNLIKPGTVTSLATGAQEARPDGVPRSESTPLKVGISDQERTGELDRLRAEAGEAKSKKDLVFRFKSELPPCVGKLTYRWNHCVGDTNLSAADASDSNGIFSADKFSYKGEYRQGVPHGRGIYRTSRNQVYEGELKYGKFDGIGVFYSEGGDVISSGTWRGDLLERKHDVSRELAEMGRLDINENTLASTPQDQVKQAIVSRSEIVTGIGKDKKTTTPEPSELDRLRAEAEEAKRKQAELEAQLAAVQQAQVRPVSPVGPALSVYAIVIGNGAYQGSGRLDNPINDARAISAKLKRMGFKVTTVENADRNKLVSSLVKFSSSAAESDLTLFFYAGHGVQISGTNYMLPTDTNLNQIGGVELHGISLNSVVDRFLPGKTKLVFLDACRDNPLLQVASRSVSRGLAPISVSQGTLISYATKDGSVAADGEGKNSPFTKALLQHIDSPEDIAVVLRKVRDQVMRDTGGQQQPWEYGSLSGGSLILSAIKAK